MLGAFFSGKSNLATDQRRSILESMYNSRHQAQERLWSGKDLFTEHVNTIAQIWPQLSIAYTEKIVTVTNFASRSIRNNEQEALNTDLVDEAKKAYVVTPVSSLVVLEAKKDYERFDIKDNGPGLKNASANSKGAVPEPHEWALIIIAIGVLLYVKCQSAGKRKLNI